MVSTAFSGVMLAEPMSALTSTKRRTSQGKYTGWSPLESLPVQAVAA